MGFDFSHTGWANRRPIDGIDSVDLQDAQGQTIAVFPRDVVAQQETEVLGQLWRLDAEDNSLRAVDATGVARRATADKPFKNAQELTIELPNMLLKAVNEQRNDWVFLTEDAQTKIGQFSGGNNGVRNSYTEFEPDTPLSEYDKVFLSWVTRTVLESRLSKSTLILTLSLLALAPIILFMLL